MYNKVPYKENYDHELVIFTIFLALAKNTITCYNCGKYIDKNGIPKEKRAINIQYLHEATSMN